MIQKVYIRPAHGEEIFVDVSYPEIKKGLYKISNYGRIYNIKRNKFLNGRIDEDGYIRLNLRRNGGGNIYIGLHKLVAWEFCKGYDESNNRIIPNHLDGDPQNNFYENLQWSTYAENTQHAFDIGSKEGVKGDKSNWAKYTDEDCDYACKLKSQGLSNKEISEITGINYHYIHEIFSGKKRPHISKKYNLPKPREITFKGFSDDIKDDIVDYLKNGYKPKEICKLMNLEYNNTHKVAITNLRKKLK